MAWTGGDTIPRTWIEITDADIAAAVACPAQFWAAVHNNTEMIKCALYGDGSFVGAYPHAHRGSEDAPFSHQGAENLVINSAPSTSVVGGSDNSERYWIRDDKSVTELTSTGYLFQGKEGGAAHVWLVQNTRTANTDEAFFLNYAKALWGGKGRITISGWMKAESSGQTCGMISFGISDGGSRWVSECRADVSYLDLTTSWKRFYAFVDVHGIEEGARFSVACTKQSDRGVYATAFSVTPGWHLGYWWPHRLDLEEPSGDHHQWKKFGIVGVPVFEKSTAITNAVQLTGA